MSPLLQDAQSAFAQGDYPGAARLIDGQLARGPVDAEALFLRGACADALGDVETALRFFIRATEQDPGFERAQQGRAAVLLRLGRTDEAFAVSASLVERFAGNPRNLTNHATLVEARGEIACALELHERALQLDPAFAAARLGRGLALIRLGRTGDAVENAAALLQEHPDDAEAHAHLGEALLAHRRYADALAAFERVLALAPAHALAQIKRGYALSALRRFGDAAAAFAAARELDAARVEAFRRALVDEDEVLPELDPEAIYLAREHERQLVCDWTGRGALLQVFRGAIRRPQGPPTERGLVFASLALPLEPEERLALARSVSGHIAAGVPRTAFPPAARTGRVRIGYVSADFRNHVAARLLLPLLRGQDRRSFEVFGYALCADDGSELRRSVESAFDVFRDLSGVRNRAAAEAIARDRLDVLVDLSGYTTDSRFEILAARPAPVQASYLGFVGSTGAGFIDYAVTDRVATPPGCEHWWSEQLVFLPHTFFLYDAGLPRVVPPVARRDYGLPEEAVVFCAFHNPNKIDPEVFAAWLDVLRGVPGSVLWLQDPGADCVTRLREQARPTGIPPARLVAAPREEHARYMARLALADLYLDSFRLNAMSTACDGLWMGLPLVTLAGKAAPERTAASILCAAGLPELVTSSRDGFVTRATALARDPAARAALRQRIRDARSGSALFDAAARVRHLDRAFLWMAERSRQGLPPASFAVPPGGTSRSAETP